MNEMFLGLNSKEKDVWSWLNLKTEKREVVLNGTVSNSTDILVNDPNSTIYHGYFPTEPKGTIAGSPRKIRGGNNCGLSSWDRIVQMCIPSSIYESYKLENRRFALKMSRYQYTGAGMDFYADTYNGYTSLAATGGRNTRYVKISIFVFEADDGLLYYYYPQNVATSEEIVPVLFHPSNI